MRVNNVNPDSHTAYSFSSADRKIETAEPLTAKNFANADKFVLNLPVSETVCKRTEFVTDERMGEGCAYCYTYIERTLTFESEKYGTTTMSHSSGGGYFAINLDTCAQTFGKSGSDMNNIEHAVEETYERRERTLTQSTVSGSLSGTVTGNGQTVGGSLEFAAQSTAYKYLSASQTAGTVAYKNGGAGCYRETAVSSREIYNKCAVFLAEAFGEKRSALVLSDRDFEELFGKIDGDGEALSKNMAQKRESLGKQLSRLKEFMENNLAAVRKKSPGCGSLKAFADTYRKLEAYKYSEITALVQLKVYS